MQDYVCCFLNAGCPSFNGVIPSGDRLVKGLSKCDGDCGDIAEFNGASGVIFEALLLNSGL